MCHHESLRVWGPELCDPCKGKTGVTVLIGTGVALGNSVTFGITVRFGIFSCFGFGSFTGACVTGATGAGAVVTGATVATGAGAVVTGASGAAAGITVESGAGVTRLTGSESFSSTIGSLDVGGVQFDDTPVKPTKNESAKFQDSLD